MFKLGTKYSRNEVNEILVIEPQGYATGIHECRSSKKIILYTDLVKDKNDNYGYQNYFENDYFHWDSQNRQDINSDQIQRMVKKEVEVLLFCRMHSKVKGETQKFVYCGILEYSDYDSSTAKPVHMIFESLDYQDDNKNKELIDLWGWNHRSKKTKIDCTKKVSKKRKQELKKPPLKPNEKV